MTRYSKTMNEILAGIRGVSQINEAPEDNEPASPDEGGMAMDQLKFIEYAAKEIMQHIQGGGDFPEWMQNKLSGTHEKMKGLHANIDHDNMEESVQEAAPKISQGKAKGSISATGLRGKGMKQFDVDVAVKGGKFEFRIKDDQGRFQTVGIKKAAAMFEEVELEESKSSTGYELYHKDFSTAMKHAYDFAKKKLGVDVDPKEIDDKVASGPRKPSKGKTNSYRLLGKDGKKAIQVQVYGMDNGKYELNMYKESVDLEEKLKVSDGLGAWITDFKKSDAPQFQGKSDEEKKNMAIAAFTDAGGKLESFNEEEEPQKPDSAKEVDQMRDDKKKTRVAQLQLQIAKAQETINKLNSQEK